MASLSIEYKGHIIDAESHALGGGFSWSYTIDGTNFRESRDRPLKSEDAMLREALDHTKRFVDTMSRD